MQKRVWSFDWVLTSGVRGSKARRSWLCNTVRHIYAPFPLRHGQTAMLATGDRSIRSLIILRALKSKHFHGIAFFAYPGLARCVSVLDESFDSSFQGYSHEYLG